MQDGLYICHFSTPLDEASGVVAVNGDLVQGGDGGMYYSGHIRRDGDHVDVTMTVRRYVEVTQSVFGDFESLTLTISGTAKGDPFVLEGRADVAPSLRFRVEARRTKV